MEKENITDSSELFNYGTSISNYLASKLTNDLTSKINYIFTEGLKLKGYEFQSKNELEEFVKKYCRCDFFPSKQHKIFYVKEEPFLLYIMKEEPIINLDRNTIHGSLGMYKYL